MGQVAKKGKEAVEKLLYSRKDAAFALSISLRAVDRMLADKRLGRRVLGGRVLIPASDVRRAAQRDDYTGLATG